MLGLGKNMVSSLQAWVTAYQVASRNGDGWELTEIAEMLFGEDGLDPYLEDTTTAWLLHWMIATNRERPFWAWECMFNRCWRHIDPRKGDASVLPADPD